MPRRSRAWSESLRIARTCAPRTSAPARARGARCRCRAPRWCRQRTRTSEGRDMGILPNPLEPPGITHATAQVNGIHLHYVEGGDRAAPPLVLLHGFPESWLMWRLVLPELLASHRVVAVDLRGYGDSAKPPPEAGYDKGTMAADIRALARHLGLGRLVLIGHDRGARVARRYGLDYPDELAGVALLDILPVEHVYARPASYVAERYWHWVFQVVPELPERLIDGREELYLERFFARAPGLLERLRADGSWLEHRRAFP